MDVSLELYKVFYYVAKEQSFSRASDKLFVSQSAVSQSISQLEKKLGFKLFIRTTKTINLTIDGQILFSYIEKAFLIIEKAEQTLKNKNSITEGEIYLASTDTLCKFHLLPKIKKFNLLHPKVKFKIINGTSVYCMELLAAGKIDMAMFNIIENFDHNLFNIEKSFLFTDVFVAKKNSMSKKSMSVLELSKKPLLVLDDKSVTRQYFDKLFLDKGLKVSPEIELQSIDLLIEMAKSGLGIAFVPDICVQDNSNDLEVLSIKEPIPKRSYGLVSNKQIPQTNLGIAFIDMF